MYNFKIEFSHPWLLLLLVPALALTLIPYFRRPKKYRKTRNRITSMVLHMVIMTLAALILSGLTFSYQIPNVQNEILLLVDVSDTQKESAKARDDSVNTILTYAQSDNYRVGIVAFGFDCAYVVPMTTEVKDVYDSYTAAVEKSTVDTSATDIAAALTYAKGLFTYPDTGKIVLITDAKETDEKALTVVKAVVAQGISLDTVYVSSPYKDGDVQVTEIGLPDYHVNTGEECTLSVTLHSNEEKTASVALYDNGEVQSTQQTELVKGSQTLSFRHAFQGEGLHEISFRVTVDEDGRGDNNHYCTYLYLENFNKVLIFEREEGASANLVTLLEDENDFNVEVLNILTADIIPLTTEELCAYDQVILNNISNADLQMWEGLDKALYAYVYEHGGGVFTTGGNDPSGNANAYNRQDMYGTLYQQMLPVQAIDYTPPVGVMVIIDTSSSMDEESTDGLSMLEWAKAGATSCLSVLTERDYFGLMTLDSHYSTILPLTRRTRESEILAAIQSIEEPNGGTVFPDAINRAGIALRALSEVDKRHIVIVTDGAVPEGQRGGLNGYEKIITDLNTGKNSVTLSIVAIDMKKPGNVTATSQTPIDQIGADSDYERMLRAVVLGKGELHLATGDKLMEAMKKDLSAPSIKDVNHDKEGFYPIIEELLSPVVEGVEYGTTVADRNRIPAKLYGFYGVKKREEAELILKGDYQVPLYAQWKFGRGMVGSFMCDVSGDWSSGFITDANGRRLILNAIKNLMPVESIRLKDFKIELGEENYINQLGVYGADLKDGEYIEGKILSDSFEEPLEISLNDLPKDENSESNPFVYVVSRFSPINHYSRCDFVIKRSGIYKIVLTKYSADGEALSVVETYKTFSYSQEYNTFTQMTEAQLEANLEELARQGNGKKIANLAQPDEVFEGFVTVLDRAYDPRVPFTIAALVLFLADIAVRKFKFKWPHELIREHKNKKSSPGKKGDNGAP